MEQIIHNTHRQTEGDIHMAQLAFSESIVAFGQEIKVMHSIRTTVAMFFPV